MKFIEPVKIKYRHKIMNMIKTEDQWKNDEDLTKVSEIVTPENVLNLQ